MQPSLSIWLNLCTLSGLGASRLSRLADAFDIAGNIDFALLETLLAEFPSALRRSVMQIVPGFPVKRCSTGSILA